MINLLKFFIKPMRIKISEETKHDLLFNETIDSDDEEDIENKQIKGGPKFPKVKKSLFVEQYKRDLKRKKKDLDYETVEEIDDINSFIRKIEMFLKDIEKYFINPAAPLPEHNPYLDLCFCEDCVEKSCNVNETKSLAVRMTIIYDYWFESGVPYKTKQKHPLLKYVHYIWLTQLAYRVLAKRQALLIRPKPDDEEMDGIWCSAVDFTGRGFPLPRLKKLVIPIAEWTPEEVNEAIVTLIRSRAVEGAFNLDTNVRKLTFIQYKRALIDRLAIIALFPIPYQEEHFNYEWFKGDRILNKHFDVEITKENIAAKKVKDYTDKEAADLKKAREEDPDGQDEIDKYTPMVSNDERLKSILELERQFAEIDKVTEELERLSLRIEELKKDTKGDDDGNYLVLV